MVYQKNCKRMSTNKGVVKSILVYPFCEILYRGLKEWGRSTNSMKVALWDLLVNEESWITEWYSTIQFIWPVRMYVRIWKRDTKGHTQFDTSGLGRMFKCMEERIIVTVCYYIV